MFNGIVGLDILALNNRIPPGIVYKALSESIVRPTLVIENKVLYTQKINNSAVPGYNIKLSNDGLYDTIIYSPKDCKADVTIFCYGGVLSVVEKAIERLYIEYEIRVEVICPVKIKPIDPSQTIDSVKRTHVLVTIEEGSAVGGVGAELISIVSEHVDNYKIKRISNDKLIPCSIEAENLLLPSDDSIVKGIRGLV
jgi:pyruvate/2-oxoglutarate/acetoin dehydrogenase E1 component